MYIKDIVFEWLTNHPQKELLINNPAKLREKYNKEQTDESLHLSARHARRVAKKYRESSKKLKKPKNNISNYIIHDNKYCWDTIENGYTIENELPVSTVDTIFLDYNYFGGNKTREEIDHKYGLSLDEWSFLYNELNLRKRGSLVSPYTLEQAQNKEEYLTEVLDTYHNSLTKTELTRQAANKALSRKLKRHAAKVDNQVLVEEEMMTHIIEALHDASFNYELPFKQYTNDSSTISSDRYAFVLPMYDLHIGKETVAFGGGEKHTLEDTRRLLIHHTQKLLKQVSFYDIDHIYTTVGSDQFHIDTEGGQTTSGTPVGNRETVYEVFKYGYELTTDFIMLLKFVGVPITINYVRGNHDALAGFHMLLFLNGYFKDDPQVTVKVQADPYPYETYGKNLIAFHHGDGVKKTNLTKLLAQKARKAWGETEYTYAFLGHLHHLESLDDYGTVIYQVPALCSKDSWHNLKGFHSSKGFMGFLIHEERGLTQIFNQVPVAL